MSMNLRRCIMRNTYVCLQAWRTQGARSLVLPPLIHQPNAPRWLVTGLKALWARQQKGCDNQRQLFKMHGNRKHCERASCLKRPVFNVPGCRGGRFCSKHKREGMVDVETKKCEYPGCMTVPVFNVPGLKAGRFCSEHKEQKKKRAW